MTLWLIDQRERDAKIYGFWKMNSLSVAREREQSFRLWTKKRLLREGFVGREGSVDGSAEVYEGEAR